MSVERSPLARREERRPIDGSGNRKVLDPAVGRVVQVREAGDPVRVRLQRLGEVEHVVDVVGDLDARVDPLPVPCTVDLDESVGVCRHSRPGPLLQLDDHVGRVAARRMHAGEDDVGTLRRERESILEQDLDVTEPCVTEVARGAPSP